LDLNSKDFAGYYRKHALRESTKIKSAGNWIQEVLLDESGVKGDRLPWERTWDDVGIDKGTLTIWGGWSGHGKSELLGQVVHWFMADHKVAIASLEMRPSETINRMIRQTHGAVNPTAEYKMGWMDWANDNLYIYDAIERTSRQSMLGMILYCKHELGINHIVIDSLTKCGISKDDLSGQASFVDDLQNMAKATGARVHLVTHLRKADGQKQHQEPGKDDVRGAGEITDLADVVFMVYRNKFKDSLIADGQSHIETKDKKVVAVADMWDTKLRLVKNRQNGIEMDYKLWREPSGQYTEQRGRRMQHPCGPEIDLYVKEYIAKKNA